jgi:glycosyltransferase involved in cell wall biosynthesis
MAALVTNVGTYRRMPGDQRAERPRLVYFATQGTGSYDEARITTLLEPLPADLVAFDRSHKGRSVVRLTAQVLRQRPALVVMEGTGIGGGAVVLALRVLAGIPYVVSSGDAVAPFIASVVPWAGPAALVYERLLCANSAGFIAWSPYLAGRAITLGAPRAVTAAGWAPTAPRPDARLVTRTRLGIDDHTVVFGLVGSLAWNRRRRYCYGLELVRAARASVRDDVKVLIVGDGDGRPVLEREAAHLLGEKVILSGRVARREVPDYLAAMDVGSLPQSVDGVGSFRYTTKLSEYVAARLPVVTGRLPFAYDLDDGWLWRLPGRAPWDRRYTDALAQLMDTVTSEQVEERRRFVPERPTLFDRDRQQRHVAAFLTELIEDR